MSQGPSGNPGSPMQQQRHACTALLGTLAKKVQGLFVETYLRGSSEDRISDAAAMPCTQTFNLGPWPKIYAEFSFYGCFRSLMVSLTHNCTVQARLRASNLPLAQHRDMPYK